MKLIRDYKAVRDFYKESSYTQFKGVFSSFEEAIASLPGRYKVSYDHEILANEYKEALLAVIQKKTFQLRQYDYPLLVWLKEICREGMTVCDFGGNVGVHFYTYSNKVSFLESITWAVCDLPHIIKAGNEIKMLHPDSRLKFYTQMTEIKNPDIFLISGALQYLEDLSLFDNVQATHLLINRTPFYDGPDFVTLQNGGKVFYPQKIFNRKKFMDFITSKGYELVDEWEDTVDSCYIPFHKDRIVQKYTGLYLRKKPQS